MRSIIEYLFRTSLFRFCLIIALPVLSPSVLTAKCKEYSYSVMPAPGKIPANCRFLIEGFGGGQVKIESLKSGDAVLISSQNRIALIPEHLYIGQYLVSQITLKPAEPLIEGISYTLSVTGIDSVDIFYSGDSTIKKWTSTGLIDIDRPLWTSPPIMIDRKAISHGSDPAEWIQISVPVSDENSGYILVNLKNQIETDYTRSYLLPIKKGMIRVGHGACSGPFNINSGYHYTAQLIPCDLSGNCNTQAAKVIHFSENATP